MYFPNFIVPLSVELPINLLWDTLPILMLCFTYGETKAQRAQRIFSAVS